MTATAVRTQPKHKLWGKFDGLDTAVDKKKGEFLAQGNQKVADEFRAALVEQNNAVADLRGANLITFEQSAVMIRQRDWDLLRK